MSLPEIPPSRDLEMERLDESRRKAWSMYYDERRRADHAEEQWELWSDKAGRILTAAAWLLAFVEMGQVLEHRFVLTIGDVEFDWLNELRNAEGSNFEQGRQEIVEKWRSFNDGDIDMVLSILKKGRLQYPRAVDEVEASEE